MARAGFFARRHFKRGMFGPVIFMQVGFSGCRIPLFFLLSFSTGLSVWTSFRAQICDREEVV